MKESVFEYVIPKPILGIPKEVILTIAVVLYALMTVGYYLQVKATGKMDGYSPGVSLLFVPFYEEFLFRGILLKYFRQLYKPVMAVVVVSVLFGLWHLKNIFWLSSGALAEQILYTTLVFGPIMGVITLKARSIWPAVILHYLNNFPYSAWISYFH